MPNTTDVMGDLKSKGHKVTKARKHLIDVLIKSNQPLSVPEISLSLEGFNLAPNKTTIYREIAFLIDQGIVREIDFGDNKKRYEYDLKDHHHHLVCVKCGKVEDFELEQDLRHQEKMIERERNFKVVNHSLEFFGLCGSCQRLK
jgi:Fur family ferric uptake transcriptional regulator